jgi:hypothetical protein
MTRPSKRWIVLFTVWACSLLVPAMAQARGYEWERIADPAPGSTSLDGVPDIPPPQIAFTVANGTPYLAEITVRPGRDLTVYRAVRNRAWEQVGDGPLNETGSLAFSADFATAGGNVWLAWSEGSSFEDVVVHVARITRSGVQELPGSPIAGASAPQIEYFGGRLYVAYQGSDVRAHVVRTRSNGRGFEGAGDLGGALLYPNELGEYRGRLYVAGPDSSDPLAYRYMVLNRRQTAWSVVDDPPDDLFAPRIGDTVFTLGSSGAEVPGAPQFVHVFATRHGVTQELPSPATPGNNVFAVPKLVVSNGTLWMEWVEGGPSDMAPPFVPHVARLVRR